MENVFARPVAPAAAAAAKVWHNSWASLTRCYCHDTDAYRIDPPTPPTSGSWYPNASYTTILVGRGGRMCLAADDNCWVRSSVASIWQLLDNECQLYDTPHMTSNGEKTGMPKEYKRGKCDDRGNRSPSNRFYSGGVS